MARKAPDIITVAQRCQTTGCSAGAYAFIFSEALRRRQTMRMAPRISKTSAIPPTAPPMIAALFDFEFSGNAVVEELVVEVTEPSCAPLAVL